MPERAVARCVQQSCITQFRHYSDLACKWAFVSCARDRGRMGDHITFDGESPERRRPSLSEGERETVERRTALRAAVIHEAIREEGEAELERSASVAGLVWIGSGLVDGVFAALWYRKGPFHSIEIKTALRGCRQKTFFLDSGREHGGTLKVSLHGHQQHPPSVKAPPRQPADG